MAYALPPWVPPAREHRMHARDPAIARSPSIMSSPYPWDERDWLYPLVPKRFSRLAGWTDDELSAPPPEKIALVSWNVDAVALHAGERVLRILRYIQYEVLESPSPYSPEPAAILLQEVAPEALAALLADDWVRKCFVVAPSSPDEWPRGAAYGNVTLVASTVPVVDAALFLLNKTRMGRNAVLTDIKLRDPRSSRAKPLVMRIANTHLESLPRGADVRPLQLWSLSYVLKGEENENIAGGIVAGDMNTLSPQEHNINAGAGLEDAYHGLPHEPKAVTWGYQPYVGSPPARLDRFLHSPGEWNHIGVRILPPTVIGIDLRTDRGEWVSDHYGIFSRARFSSSNDRWARQASSQSSSR